MIEHEQEMVEDGLENDMLNSGVEDETTNIF